MYVRVRAQGKKRAAKRLNIDQALMRLHIWIEDHLSSYEILSACGTRRHRCPLLRIPERAGQRPEEQGQGIQPADKWTYLKHPKHRRA